MIQCFDGDGAERPPSACAADRRVAVRVAEGRPRLEQLLDMHERGCELMPAALFEMVELLDAMLPTMTNASNAASVRCVRNEAWALWSAHP